MTFEELEHGMMVEAVHKERGPCNGIIVCFPEKPHVKYLLQNVMNGENPPSMKYNELYGYRYSWGLYSNNRPKVDYEFTKFKVIKIDQQQEIRIMAKTDDSGNITIVTKEGYYITIIKKYSSENISLGNVSINMTDSINAEHVEKALAELKKGDTLKSLLGIGVMMVYFDDESDLKKSFYESLALELRKMSSPGKRCRALKTDDITGVTMKTHVIIPE